jgi:hypothetical protein
VCMQRKLFLATTITRWNFRGVMLVNLWCADITQICATDGLVRTWSCNLIPAWSEFVTVSCSHYVVYVVHRMAATRATCLEDLSSYIISGPYIKWR